MLQTVGLSAVQLAWIEVITDLAELYPTSSWGKLPADRMQDTALKWARELTGPNAEQIPALRRRVVANMRPDRSPNLNDFISAWGDWRHELWVREQGEIQAAERAAARVRPREFPAFYQSWRAFGGPVCCDCAGDRFCPRGRRCARLMTLSQLIGSNRDSQYEGLNYDDWETRYWVCAKGACGFILLPSDLEPGAGVIGTYGSFNIAANSWFSDEPPKTERRAVRAKTYLERLEEYWETSFQSMEPVHFAAFSALVNNYRQWTGNDDLPTRQELEAFEMQQKRAKQRAG